jgi:O-antigen/teichoic acid export membrane protein
MAQLSPFHNLQRWSIKGGFSILDQIFFSGANFFANILLARWLLPEAYGSYSISFSALMFFYQIYFSFILDPMSVLGPANYSIQLKNYLVHQLKLHFIILIPISTLGFMVYWLINGFFPSSNGILLNLTIMLGVLPFLLLPWMFRRAVYVLRLPGLAALSSGLYAIILISLFIVLRATAIFTTLFVILSMAVASLLGTGFLFFLLRKDAEIHNISLKNIVNENWNYGRWLIASSLLVIVAGQAQIFIAGSVLGVEAAGIVRALQNFAQPMILVVTAFGNLAIPALSADFGRADFKNFRSKVSIISGVSISIAGIYLLLLFIFRKPLELLLYGGQYSAYSDLIPVWGIVPLLLAINVAPASALQAIQKPYALLLVSLFWTMASVGSAFLFSVLWGIWGVTVSAVFGYLIAVTVFVILYRIWVVKEIASVRSG